MVFATSLTAVSMKLAFFEVTVMNVTNAQIGLSDVLYTGKGTLECQKSVGFPNNHSSKTATRSLLSTHHFNIAGKNVGFCSLGTVFKVLSY